MTQPQEPNPPARQPAPRKSQPTVARSLGSLIRDIFKPAPGKPTKKAEPTVVRRDVQEKVINTPYGPVKLRRTTTDEVEPVRKPPGPNKTS